MSALDMSLEDVIKSKGGNSKRGARTGKAPAAKEVKKKVQNTERPKRNAGNAGIAPAMKAAAAAAAAASKPAPSMAAAAKAKSKDPEAAKEPEESKKPAVAVTAITPGKAPKGPGGATGMEDKLGMALEDVIKVQDTKKKKVTEPRDVKAGGAGGLRGRAGIRQRLAARQRQVTRGVRQQAKQPARTEARTVRGRGGARADREDLWEGGRTSRAWDGPSAGARGARRTVLDDWSPPAKRARADDWAWGGPSRDKGKGKGWREESYNERAYGYGERSYGEKGYGYGEKGYGEKGYGEKGYGYGGEKGYSEKGHGKGGSWSGDAWSSWSRPERRPEPMLQWDRAPPALPVQRALATRPVREREERERPERTERVERVERAEKAVDRSVKKSIRVCNVPKNLDDRDIQEAFEDIGRVVKCEVERGVATISFANSSHAKKAVQTFDRGELNGQTIYVSLES
eukprot:CAMPEP_0181441234 /NCGR_PEP_ID=MMETSP1110-20121109/23399_1 /TAXON_ID=174948 /ORGANISM="Symbiodinium sp., Strain CCMP421" /LENGTH=456 /DNA_ID=CAMNT_0023565105 /DNA_START=96 /DNA_END=1466 /DNA_ORIENTATION=+